MTEYTHLELGKEVQSLSGYYIPDKENRIRYSGRDILYVAGQAVIEASCCGARRWTYITIPGYVLRWQYKQNESGQPVTEVEPIKDEAARDTIKVMLKQDENPAESIIDFW